MSTLEVSNLNDGTTTVGTTFITNGSAKVWVNFNGGGTIATRDSFNVSSLTDDAVGRYTITIDSNMANDDYAAINYNSGNTSSNQASFGNQYMGGNNNQVGSFAISCYENTFVDSDVVMATVHGDLA